MMWLGQPRTPGFWWRRSPHHAPALCRVDVSVDGLVARDAYNDDHRYAIDDADARWCRADAPPVTSENEPRIAALEAALRDLCDAHRSTSGTWCMRCGGAWPCANGACRVGRGLRALAGGASC